jgi:hypothetical protein
LTSSQLSDIHDIVLKVAASALWSLFSNVGAKTARLIKRDAKKHQQLDAAVTEALRDVRARLSVEPGLETRVAAFLQFPDAEAVVRQIYASTLVVDASQSHFGAIRSEFRELLARHLGLKAVQLMDLDEYLLQAIRHACEARLTYSADSGSLLSHEALSSSRHHLLMDELAAIEKNLALLLTSTESIQPIDAFEAQYRKQVCVRHGFISPPNFDAAKKIPIGELYVQPTFYATPSKKGERPDGLAGC